jgi:thioredoxin-related protein
MKKLFFLLFIFNNSIAQQVNFNDIKWETALKWSKETKRNIFLYVYSDSSPSSKTFETSTLTDSELTEHLNNYFLCVKLNANSEQGLDFQQKYNIDKLPSILFFGMYENLLVQNNGQINAADLLELCDKAVHTAFDDDVLSNYLNEFEDGKKDVEFLKKYIKLLKEMSYDCSEPTEALYSQLTDSQRLEDEYLQLLDTANLNYIDISSNVFQFLNSLKGEAIFKKYANLKSQTKNIIYSTIPEAGKKKDEGLFLKADSLILSFEDKNESANMQFFRRLNFYQNIPNSEKLMGFIDEYLDRNVLNISDSVKNAKDLYYTRTSTIPTVDMSYNKIAFPAFYHYEKPYRQWLATVQSIIANAMVNSFKKDNEILEKALILANNAIDFGEQDMYLIVKAKILYRLNRLEEAKTEIRKAIDLNKERKVQKYYYDYQDFEGLLKQMETGEY